MRARSTYEWLRREPVRGYRAAQDFVALVEDISVRDLDEEIRTAKVAYTIIGGRVAYKAQ